MMAVTIRKAAEGETYEEVVVNESVSRFTIKDLDEQIAAIREQIKNLNTQIKGIEDKKTKALALK